MKTEDLISIYHYFGKDAQDSKFYEEMVELLDAYDMGNKKDVIEEKADVFIMAYQHYLMSPEVQKLVEEKIERTKKRMASNYYEVQ